MNKQEAIERIKNIGTLNIFDKATGQQVDMVIKNEVLDIISQIYETQKPVIPKFVAEWIEKCKEKDGYTLSDALSPDVCPLDIDRWFYLDAWEKENLFAQAWLFGYEIEQEQLYTVEIPNPNADGYSIVLGRKEGKVLIKQDWSTTWEMNCSNQLTESEIKEDFEWAWQFATPVEVE